MKIATAINKAIENENVALSILLFFSLLMRIVFHFASSAVLWPDSLHYYRFAQAILDHLNFSAHAAYHTPLYSLFLALHLWLCGETPLAGELFIFSQQILGIASTILTYKIAYRTFNPQIAFVSGLLFCFHSLLICYEMMVLTEVLFLFLVSALIWTSLLLKESPSFKGYILVGLLCAALTLTRSVGLYFVFITIAYIAWPFRGSLHLAKVASTTLLAFFIAITPWCLSNYQNLGFFGVSKGQGLNLFLRTFQKDKLPLETEDPKAISVYSRFLELEKKDKRAYFSLYYELKQKLRSEAKADDLMLAVALPSVLAHPFEYAYNSLTELYSIFFEPRVSPAFCFDAESQPYLCVRQTQGTTRPAFPNKARSDQNFSKNIVFLFVNSLTPPIAIISLLAIIGVGFALARFPERRPETIFFLATIFYFTTLACLLNMPEDRYRLPVDGLLFTFATIGIFNSIQWTIERYRKIAICK